MAKRMGFSVVGLPHYTIWHLYEPSVDDLRHMEEMEEERKALEQEEAERLERLERQKDIFQSPNAERELDNAAVQDLRQREKLGSESTTEGNEDKAGDGAGFAAVPSQAVGDAGVNAGAGSGSHYQGES